MSVFSVSTATASISPLVAIVATRALGALLVQFATRIVTSTWGSALVATAISTLHLIRLVRLLLGVEAFVVVACWVVLLVLLSAAVLVVVVTTISTSVVSLARTATATLVVALLGSRVSLPTALSEGIVGPLEANLVRAILAALMRGARAGAIVIVLLLVVVVLMIAAATVMLVE